MLSFFIYHWKIHALMKLQFTIEILYSMYTVRLITTVLYMVHWYIKNVVFNNMFTTLSTVK